LPAFLTAREKCARLADLAVCALIAESELTPKPALVDGRGPGAHTDLSLDLLMRSAQSLRDYFEQMARASFCRPPGRRLRERLGSIGRAAESSMLRVTNGTNTHRGAIWALGLLVSSSAMESESPEAIAHRAGEIAQLPDRSAPNTETNGKRAGRRYNLSGAREEAVAGFPHVVSAALPALRRSRWNDETETHAGLNALLAIMADLDDTCLLHRGGLAALTAAKHGAAAVIEAGGTSTQRGWQLLLELDRELLRQNSSPGGSADLLAATFFLDFVDRSLSTTK
jgi:triphosphoribosyl-dephospho-CoA synthase